VSDSDAKKILDFLAWRSGWETWKLVDWWARPSQSCELVFFCRDSVRMNGEVFLGPTGDDCLPLLFSKRSSLGNIVGKLLGRKVKKSAVTCEGPLGRKAGSSSPPKHPARVFVLSRHDTVESLSLASCLLEGCFGLAASGERDEEDGEEKHAC